MTFLEAVVAISKRDDIRLCEDLDELNGILDSICVYRGVECIGKLRWPTVDHAGRYAAYVDEYLESVLLQPPQPESSPIQ